MSEQEVLNEVMQMLEAAPDNPVPVALSANDVPE